MSVLFALFSKKQLLTDRLKACEFNQTGYNSTSCNRGINWLGHASVYETLLARIISFRAPYLEFNFSRGAFWGLLNRVDEKNEANRDLRYSSTPILC